ncbi:MAG: hypothetical protein ABIQ76_05095, partial [Candidatus Limnocylindrales bacterium]
MNGITLLPPADQTDRRTVERHPDSELAKRRRDQPRIEMSEDTGHNPRDHRLGRGDAVGKLSLGPPMGDPGRPNRLPDLHSNVVVDAGAGHIRVIA